MCTDCDVCIVSGTLMGVVNTTKSLIEEVIETFMYAVCLAHYYCMTFYCRVTNCSNCVYLKYRESDQVRFEQTYMLRPV